MAILLGPPEIYNPGQPLSHVAVLPGPPPEIPNSTHSHDATSSSTAGGDDDPFMDLVAADYDGPAFTGPGPPLIDPDGPPLIDPAWHVYVPFMDRVVADFNEIQILPHQNMGFTENNSATFISTGDPCLDFFFHIVPDTPSSSLVQRLQLAWSHNPLTTLKLVCNLRGVRGTGKSDKEGFYAAALWLYTNHPRTLAINVPSFAEFGFFKDLPEILYRILEGLDVRKIQKQEWQKRKGRKKYNMKPRRGKDKKKLSKNIRIPEVNRKEMAHAEREEKRIAMAKKVLQRYQNDANFCLLYDHISDHFAECLKEDIEFLKREEPVKISLAAKWCPSIDSSFDRSTLLCESIARRIFPRESYPEYEGIAEAHYAYRIRERLRKEILVPLRKALELPEVYIGANQWGSLPYNRVASVAMKFYTDKFMKHDEERFTKYLEDVKSGKSTIAAGALLPHEIIRSLDYDEDNEQVAELQWKRMVDDLLKKGKLRSSLAICDVSGSMTGIPMEVSVAMGLLVSETSEKPWKGKVITFSANPELHVIKGKDLKSKMEFVKGMEWGANTDFQKVFDVILKVAVKANLKEDQMIKRVFVFSDMEFDQASCNPWETDYEVIKRKYREKGFGSAVPQIVFWNLRNSRATPVASNQDGVALVSGFSKNLLQMFLDNDGAINPQAVMEAAIAGKEYDRLRLLD
ncbi:uncharacterized protein LOC114729127 [Neltuma alba]|uniref:uncharacterized protein LOC114729127 n=1 Tax=Neltuma alba TaxID=207710 RepID=UPI0010A3568D|nr:uncharacterized protein LOC114729127 [Prosopis alba]